MILSDTIYALSTANGSAAIAVIRLSGGEALSVAHQIFKPKMGSKNLLEMPSHTVHLGWVMDGLAPIDEALFTLFKNPHSYTGEDVVEIACHGSVYVQQRIMQLLHQKGIRLAEPGEFTLRAYMNGKMDLTQAEAVADLIASENQAAHQLAINQMRGGFSLELQKLREKLIEFAALLELELDFSEEDVEFADRTQFKALLKTIETHLKHLSDSFVYGNVIKEGIHVVIAGKPNAGKSSLLNALLNEDKAIVSDIAGTTRDVIEDALVIEGIKFRFVDTAGLRDTQDQIEKIGVERTLQKINQAQLLLYLFDPADTTPEEVETAVESFAREGLQVYLVQNKWDKTPSQAFDDLDTQAHPLIKISAKDPDGLQPLKTQLLKAVHSLSNQNGVVVSNARHLEALQNSLQAIIAVQTAIHQNLSGELIAYHVRQAIAHLASITGDVDVDRDILGTIFGKFCIGK